MNDSINFTLPEITEEDVRWISELLDVPFDTPRKVVLRSMEQLDVAACPGSGKTTLLVAKLAILAEKWQERTRGICVLSHTNVAGHEIETKLGKTTAVRRLTSYPHFIGTIHEFINKFLMLPLLRSFDIPEPTFDDEIAGDKIWALGKNDKDVRPVLEKLLDSYNIDNNAHNIEKALKTTHYFGEDRNFRFYAGGSMLLLKKEDDPLVFEKIKKWKRGVLREGYVTYDDTFGYAHFALKNHPYLLGAIRDRFPLLFIDEAQDNSEDQSAILHRIFIAGNAGVIRQRLGDENQAIFDMMGVSEAATDKFPSIENKKELPNSHRFGQTIADLANPLGITSYDAGFIGQGPKAQLDSGKEAKHKIFLFGDNARKDVLNVYGQLLLETFSEKELQDGTFTAVGHRHRPPEVEKANKFPYHIGHFWPAYDSELTGQDPQPGSFLQYILVGLAKAKASGGTHLVVEKIADGILRLVSMADIGKPFARRKQQNHQYVLNLLEKHDDAQKRYKELLVRLAVEREPITKQSWDVIKRSVQEIADCIVGASFSNSDTELFLAWRDVSGDSSVSTAHKKSRDNVYRYSQGGKEVGIRVGSIHSVKGETHTATLVLETFWYEHNLNSLLPWLCGEYAAGQVLDDKQKSRLKLHYVAMTRPTHLLCLAMKQSRVFDKYREKLRDRGWCFVDVV